MRNIFIILIGIIFAGCENWFDVSPKTEIKADDMFEDERGFMDALTGAYSLASKDNLYGKELTIGFVEVLGQTYDGLLSSINSPYLNAFNFDYTTTTEENRLKRIWKGQYNVIMNINAMLSFIDKQQDVFSGENYRLVKGEALALRGFLHFDLLRLFAPAPSSGKEQYAIPYVDRYTNQAFPQQTVGQVLDKIVADVDSARVYLKKADIWGPDSLNIDKDRFPVYMKDRGIHVNYYAATALLARLYLYAGEKSKAFACASEVIESGRFELVTGGITGIYRSFPSEHIFALSKKDLSTTLENLYGDGGYASSVSMTQDKIDNIYYNESVNIDLRKTWWFEGVKVLKFNSSTKLPLLRLSEMYLIAAECATEMEMAQQYLNELRAHRNLPALPEFGGDRDGFVEALESEIVKEQLLDGQLFFYYKRTNETNLPGKPELTDTRAVYNLPIPQGEFEFGNMKE